MQISIVHPICPVVSIAPLPAEKHTAGDRQNFAEFVHIYYVQTLGKMQDN